MALHTAEDIKEVCTNMLAEGVMPTRSLVLKALQERAVQMGFPKKGASSAVIDRIVEESIKQWRAGRDKTEGDTDNVTADAEMPASLTLCLDETTATVARLYREGVMQAARRAEFTNRLALEAVQAECDARVADAEKDLERSRAERTTLAAALDGVTVELDLAAARNQVLEVDLDMIRVAHAELERDTRAQAARLEDDLRGAHAARSGAESEGHAAQAARQRLEVELAALTGAHAVEQASRARAEERALALHSEVAQLTTRVSFLTEQLLSAGASLLTSTAECTRLRDEMAVLTARLAVADQRCADPVVPTMDGADAAADNLSGIEP